MTDHTSEPWRTDNMPEASSAWYMQLSRKDWLRAKACVNACAGIPTEQLHKFSVSNLVATVVYFERNSDTSILGERWLNVLKSLNPFLEEPISPPSKRTEI